MNYEERINKIWADYRKDARDLWTACGVAIALIWVAYAVYLFVCPHSAYGLAIYAGWVVLVCVGAWRNARNINNRRKL